MSFRHPKQRPVPSGWRYVLLSLSPIQEAIMRSMVEPGSADMKTIVNDVRLKHRDVPPDALIAAVENAVEGLWSAGVITFCRYQHAPKREWVHIEPSEAQQYLSLHEVLMWDATEGYWRWSECRLDSDELHLCMPEKVLHAFRDEHGF